MLPLAAVLLPLACSGGQDGAGGIVAVHNALQAMGFSQVGEVSEGILENGRTSQFTFDLAEGVCYVFLAIGGPGVSDIDLELVSPGGQRLAGDETSDRQSVLRICAQESGEHTLSVAMRRGSGRYLLAHWAGGDLPEGAGVPGSGATASTVEGTCGNPIALELGRTITGNTATATDFTDGTCVPPGSPDQAYEITLDRRAQVCIDMTSSYDGALFLQRECGQVQTEVACNDDAPDTRHSALSETLDPGTYYVIASGYAGGSGSYSVTAAVAESLEPTQVCAQAAPLVPGQLVTGTTAGCLPDTFQATCAAGARSPEKVYRLDLSKRSRVRIEASTTSHDGALYLRSNCTDPASEVACNDDYRDTRHSLVTATLDPGAYYVFADGYAEGNQGPFTLRAMTAEVTGAGVDGDSCTKTLPLSAGRITGSTMAAGAHMTGSCATAPDAPDLVYKLRLTEASRLRANLARSDMRTALYLQSTCGQQSSELACETGGTLERLLQPGTYYLVVDGTGPNEFGDFEMDVEIRSTREMEARCRAAPLLRPGTPATGTTSGPDEFHASCAGGARSPETIYRLQLARRQHVRLSLESSYDGALYVRRDCLDESTELACNDDHVDTRHSLIETTLDRGTYYVFVDGFASGNEGQYTLNVELRNP